MKKVLLMATDSNISGASLSMIYLIKKLKDKNIDTYTIIPNHGDLEEILKNEEIKYQVIKTYSWIIPKNSKTLKQCINYCKFTVKYILNKASIKKIRKYIKKNEIDLVHINSLYSYVGAIAAIQEQKKIIWHIREFLEEDQNNKFAVKKYAINLISKSDKIICISKSIYNKFSKIFPKDKMSIIYNGIDIEKFKPHTKKILKNKIKKFILVGTIQEGKGQKDLVLAVDKLVKENINEFQVYFMGMKEENYFSEIEQLIMEKHLESYIHYIGMSKDVKSHMLEADISFVCSKNEAFGRVTIESMLCGCLVIGANTAGTRELIIDGKTGLLYQQGNFEDLAQVIKYALENSDKANLIAKEASKYASHKYNASLNADNIYKLYQSIL